MNAAANGEVEGHVPASSHVSCAPVLTTMSTMPVPMAWAMAASAAAR